MGMSAYMFVCCVYVCACVCLRVCRPTKDTKETLDREEQRSMREERVYETNFTYLIYPWPGGSLIFHHPLLIFLLNTQHS